MRIATVAAFVLATTVAVAAGPADAASLGPFTYVASYAAPKYGPLRTANTGEETITGDFNGDGRTDLLIPNVVGDGFALWYGKADGSLTIGPNITVHGLYQAVVGDFNGDGRDDILWYNSLAFLSFNNYASSLWLGAAGVAGFVHGPAIPQPPIGMSQIVAGGHFLETHFEAYVGDFNGDGKEDAYFTLRDTTGPVPANVVFYGSWKGFVVGPKSTAPFTGDNQTDPFPINFGARRFTSTLIYNIPRPLVADYNGDGRADLLWYSQGHTRLWRGATGRTTGFTNVAITTVYGNYQPAIGDFNGDGNSDVFWWSPSNNKPSSIWRGSAAGFANAIQVNMAPGPDFYQPVVGDYNGDGRADIFWADGDGLEHTWFGQSSGFTHGADTVSTAIDQDTDSLFPITGDFNGDGHTDLLWWHDHNIGLDDERANFTFWRGN